MNTAPEYIPGTCNIGPKEIKNRRNGAIFNAILGIAIIILFLVLHVNPLWRLVLFIPTTSFAVGFQQWYNHFCVGFGLKGVFNFGDIGKTFTVEQKEDYNKDRAKAWRMIIIGIIFGLVLATVFYFLPL
jgi:hypothetical protein